MHDETARASEDLANYLSPDSIIHGGSKKEELPANCKEHAIAAGWPVGENATGITHLCTASYQSTFMKKILPIVLLFVFACRNDQPTGETPPPVPVVSSSLVKQSGDCTDPAPASKCAEVRFSFPVVTDAQHPLKKPVEQWAYSFLAGLLDPTAPAEEILDDQSLQNLINDFFAMHEELVADFPEAPAWYTVESKDSVLLNDGRLLSLRMSGYSYTGGAHPNFILAAVSFDAQTGRRIDLSDLVTDLDALAKVAEQFYRREKAEIFEEGFDFDPEWPFVLPAAAAITAEGIYMGYMPYEVAPYAVGSAEFVIPFSEINDLLKPGWQVTQSQ